MTLWDCQGKVPAVIALQVQHRMSVARLVKSSASCTDDIISTLILPLCSTFITSQSMRPKSGTHTCLKVFSREYPEICTAGCKNWNVITYSELLWCAVCPPLKLNHRLYLKLWHMFKIVNACYFPPEIVVQSPGLLHSSRPPLLHQTFSRTTAFANSFVPNTIRKWNCLPTELVNAPTLHSFRTLLCVFTCN